ncbi:MAG: hypothetical protein VB876_15670 [Pirellulales bacterium]
MARRKKGNAGGSLDSLLDTMTNVVGILVIVLVVTQLGVGDAVNRIGNNIEINPERIVDAERAAKRRSDLEAELAQLNSDDAETVRIDLQEQVTTQAKRQKDILNQREQQQAQRLKEAEKLEDEQIKRIAELEKQERDLQNQLASLKNRLRITKPPEVLPAKIVNLPNPRKATPGAKPINFICRDGVIMPVNIEAAQDRANKWTSAYITKNRLDRDKKKGIDCDKLFRAFNRQTFRSHSFALHLEQRNDYAYVVFRRRGTAGETVQEIKDADSDFQQAIGKLNQNQHYLRFLVWTDSYETYLTARRIANKYRLPAGWQPISGESEYQVRMRGNLRCGPPPPPTKPTTPRPTEPRPSEPPREAPIDTID